VQIPAQSSAVYVSLNEKELLAGADPDDTLLVFELNVAGRAVSRGEVFFDRMRNLKLPLQPNMQRTISGAGGKYTITLRSPVVARNVYISFGNLDVSLSDNYFDLLPGDEMVLELKSDADLETLEHAMQVISLTDAFFDQRPSYRAHIAADAPAGSTSYESRH